MPGLSGIQTMALIRRLYPDMPILISSGQPEIAEWDCFRQSKVSVISKPFSIEELQTTLAQFW
jgi:CheY-like chemotaxis protein